MPKRKKTLEEMSEEELLLDKFKGMVLEDMGLPKDTDLSDLTAKQCGAIGGQMVKKMMEAAKGSIEKEVSQEIARELKNGMDKGLGIYHHEDMYQ